MSGYTNLPSKRHHWSLRSIHWGVLTLAGMWLGSGAIALGEQTAVRSTAVDSARVSRPILKKGSQGETVRELQATLKLLGYHKGAVSGTYDAETVAAVSRFQQAAGIRVDGVAGQETWERLFPAAAIAAPTTPAANQSAAKPPATPVAKPTQKPTQNEPTDRPVAAAKPDTIHLPVLKVGMKGPAVIGLQERLRAIGVFSGMVDGVFGAETLSAVKTAQRNNRLAVDGVVGPDTWKVLLRHAQ